jgi:type VI protein secretion system component VasF
MAGHYQGEPVASGLTRATVVSPSERARRRARRQRIVWTVALLVVLVAAAWLGHLLWDAYFSAGEPASGQLTP